MDAMFKQLLTAFKDPNSVSSWTLKDWEKQLLLIRYSRLLGTFHHLLKGAGISSTLPEPVIFHLESATTHAERQANQVRFEASELGTLLRSKESITGILLKGAAYTINNTQNSQGRICSDIDLLVSKQELAAAESLLLKNLWRHQKITDYDDKYYREFAHEIPPLLHLERATVLDLHHNIYLPISGRAPDMDAFLKHTQDTPYGLKTLTPPAAFVHSVIHLFLNEEINFGLRDTVDQWLLAVEFADDKFWNDVYDLCRSNGFLFELSLTVAIINAFYDYPVPQLLHEKCSGVFKSFSFRWWKTIYQHALIPAHTSSDTPLARLCRFMVFIRGHWIKMPLPILLKHFAVKGYKGLLGLVAGEDEKKKKALVQ